MATSGEDDQGNIQGGVDRLLGEQVGPNDRVSPALHCVPLPGTRASEGVISIISRNQQEATNGCQRGERFFAEKRENAKGTDI